MNCLGIHKCDKIMEKSNNLLIQDSELWLPLREQEKLGTKEKYKGETRGNGNTSFFVCIFN